MLAIRLPEDIEKRLAKLAKATGRTKTFYAREAILEHLDDLEDLYVAQQRLKRPVDRIKQADLEKELGLDD
jgi:RHH-type transcriptional regulator, rel operon repressor / antitoxin RelB